MTFLDNLPIGNGSSMNINELAPTFRSYRPIANASSLNFK